MASHPRKVKGKAKEGAKALEAHLKGDYWKARRKTWYHFLLADPAQR